MGARQVERLPRAGAKGTETPSGAHTVLGRLWNFLQAPTGECTGLLVLQQLVRKTAQPPHTSVSRGSHCDSLGQEPPDFQGSSTIAFVSSLMSVDHPKRQAMGLGVDWGGPPLCVSYFFQKSGNAWGTASWQQEEHRRGSTCEPISSLGSDHIC